MTEVQLATLSPAELEAEATKMLRRSGHTWAGRRRREVKVRQCIFEDKRVRGKGIHLAPIVN